MLVVGAGNGIGAETALLLAHAGADVAAADVDADRARAVAAQIVELGRRGVALSGDVTAERDAVRLVDETDAALGGIDAVVNIVGLAAWTDLLSIDDETWHLDIARNLTQHLYVGRAAAKAMIARGTGGSIAVVASVSGIYASPHHGAYGAAKAGLIDLVRTMAQEWGPHGIRVNAVAPDVIATPRVKAQLETAGVNFDQQATSDGVPLCRAGLPDEVAGPLVFLVSDLASFVNGQTIIVDGGQRAAFPHFKTAAAMK